MKDGSFPPLSIPKTLGDAIRRAVDLIVEDVRPRKVILFGSSSRGEAGDDSDLDLLVIMDPLQSKHREMVRLTRLLMPLRVPFDLLVYSKTEVEEWGHLPGSVLYEALSEGLVLYDAA